MILQAPASLEPEISKAVKTVVDELNAYVDKSIEIKQQKNERFMGFFVDAPDDKFFQNIGDKYVETVKSFSKYLIVQSTNQFQQQNYRFDRS